MNKILEILGMIFALLVILLLKGEHEKSILNDKEEEDEDHDNRRVVTVDCQKIDDTYYAWLKDTQKFIGQSESPRELALLLMSKYPIKTYNVIIEETVT